MDYIYSFNWAIYLNAMLFINEIKPNKIKQQKENKMKYILIVTFLIMTGCTKDTPPSTTGGETSGSVSGGESTGSGETSGESAGVTSGESTGGETSGSTTAGETSGSEGGGETTASTSGGSSGGGSTSGGSTSGGTTPTPPPQPTTGTYPVFQGCSQVSSTFKNTYTVSGSFDPKKVLPGTHVKFPVGTYGNISLIVGQQPQLAKNTEWVWLDFTPGSKVGIIDIRGLSHILITGASASGQGQFKSVIDVGYGSDNIVIADNVVSSGTNLSMTDAEWKALASGIDVGETTCASVLRNKLTLVRHGFGINSNIATYPANSCKILIQENELQHFSADGARMNCSDLIFRKNKFLDGWLDASVDGNHDDMIQGFALNGKVFENILVEENTFIDRYSAQNTKPGNYQGVSIFDGLFKNVTVRKNVVSGGAYHGISLYGTDTGLIENNTVISSTGLKTYWISTPASKNGGASKNITVRNNLANRLTVSPAWVVNANNFVVSQPAQEFVLWPTDYHLKTSSQFYGKGAGAL